MAEHRPPAGIDSCYYCLGDYLPPTPFSPQAHQPTHVNFDASFAPPACERRNRGPACLPNQVMPGFRSQVYAAPPNRSRPGSQLDVHISRYMRVHHYPNQLQHDPYQNEI
ncbi:uncharacterized protein BKA55DRAFT_628932 [Fusarium redolens]|uniref:Uncharacterized protein n=1 Tax=Fusarium redolens TaxID=48865 RepID=A0A9P9FUE3_FUSRE|nr:uncharacterized protein BKA55DRAFT_628932 [Fusarium redolens]KAH7205441.1 hypothetical protein BKA55DRAFT_628932 [Fusarium redolens]